LGVCSTSTSSTNFDFTLEGEGFYGWLYWTASPLIKYYLGTSHFEKELCAKAIPNTLRELLAL